MLRYFHQSPKATTNTIVVNDSAILTVSAALNNKVDKSAGRGLSQNNYSAPEKNKLGGVEEGAEVNVQADWDEEDITSDAYIKNKPIILAGVTGVKGDAETTYRRGNVNLTATNIGLGNVANINQSKAIKSITRDGTTFTYTCLDGTIGTFTQQDNNTWRPILCDSTSIGNNTLNLKAGTNVSLSNSNGTITISSTDTDTWPSNVSLLTNDSGYITSSGSCSYATSAGSVDLLSTSRTLWGLSFNGSKNVSGDLVDVGNILFLTGQKSHIGGMIYFDKTYSRIGINNDSPQYNLHIDGSIKSKYTVFGTSLNDDTVGFVMCNGNTTVDPLMMGSAGTHPLHIISAGQVAISISPSNLNVAIGSTSLLDNYKLYVLGKAKAYAFDTESDIRFKNVIENKCIPVLYIANAPSFIYTYKNSSNNEDKFIGSSALYWKEIIPEAVTESNDKDKTLSLQYGNLALSSAISLAKELLAMKEEIQALKNKIRELNNINNV